MRDRLTPETRARLEALVQPESDAASGSDGGVSGSVGEWTNRLAPSRTVGREERRMWLVEI